MSGTLQAEKEGEGGGLLKGLQKRVKSSTATREKRYVIVTPIIMDGVEWEIQLTLTDRSEMTYMMLLGREAMSGRFIVDPEHDFLLTSKD